MTFTSNSDLYGAINEEGTNKVVRHIMRQRPSLFNYGTARVIRNPRLLCVLIDATSDVLERGNPLITVEEPLPLLGTKSVAGLDYCVQLTKVEIDFHPGNRITLPSELNPPLKEQRFAVRLSVCGGLGCPSQRELDIFLEELNNNQTNPGVTNAANPRQTTFPVRELRCFCLELFVVGHFEIGDLMGRRRLLGKVDGLEIVDVRPEGLESNIECYLNLLIQLIIFPKASVAIEKLIFEILADLPMIELALTTTIPNNPAIEDEQTKIFIDFEVSS